MDKKGILVPDRVSDLVHCNTQDLQRKPHTGSNVGYRECSAALSYLTGPWVNLFKDVLHSVFEETHRTKSMVWIFG